jgi:uncharacterized membrane protein YphA (DoxX/SURF4 family)
LIGYVGRAEPDFMPLHWCCRLRRRSRSCDVHWLVTGGTMHQVIAESALLARILLGMVFLVAGGAKLSAGTAFRSAVADYRVLPESLVPLVSRVLPAMEIAGALLLIAGVAVRWVAPVSGLLLIAFATAIAANLARGRQIDCGCAGKASRPISWRHVAWDLALAGAAAFVTVAGTAAGHPAPWRAVLLTLAAVGMTMVAASLAQHGRTAMRAAGQ